MQAGDVPFWPIFLIRGNTQGTAGGLEGLFQGEEYDSTVPGYAAIAHAEPTGDNGEYDHYP
jgi:hypothetical protein